MDIANFQFKYPEIEILSYRTEWIGEGLEFYSFDENKYLNLCSSGQALMYPISKSITTEKVEGLINSCTIIGKQCSLVFIKENSRILIGFVRGDKYCSAEQEIEFDDFIVSESFDQNNPASTQWDGRDDFFDISNDLEELLNS